MTELTKEIVIVVHSPIEGKENVAFRVAMRPQQIADLLQKMSYCGEIFGAFMQTACEILELDMSTCTADALFPDIVYNPDTVGVPRDLLRPTVGMYTSDFTDGTLLLH